MAHYEIYDLVTSSDFCKVVVIEVWVIQGQIYAWGRGGWDEELLQ